MLNQFSNTQIKYILKISFLYITINQIIDNYFVRDLIHHFKWSGEVFRKAPAPSLPICLNDQQWMAEIIATIIIQRHIFDYNIFLQNT